jgi:hypothetical protein
MLSLEELETQIEDFFSNQDEDTTEEDEDE